METENIQVIWWGAAGGQAEREDKVGVGGASVVVRCVLGGELDDSADSA